MGYGLNRLHEPICMAVPKPLLTEFGIHHRLESCGTQVNPRVTSVVQRKNFRRDVSMSCRFPWMIQSYSPKAESKVPFCKLLSLSVNLGPSSLSLHFSADLNSYRWWRKKMKSRWLWTGLVTNTILFCWLFTIKDQFQKVRFLQTTLGRVSTFEFPRRTKNSMYYPLIRAW